MATDYNRIYDEDWHRSPLYSQDMSTEGAFKRFMAMPGPQEVFDYAMLGLPRYLPLTQQYITPEGLVGRESGVLEVRLPIADFLTSAISEIEMSMDCNISEVTHFHTEDLIDGMPDNNFYGIRLSRWPAVAITKMSMKYPHATANDGSLYAEYTIPKTWITLRRNKINVVAAVGSISVDVGGGSAVSLTQGGLFTYISGFHRGPWQPNSIEVVYKAGFEHDKLPAVVADLIKTWAAGRYLGEIAPVLFPQSSVSVAIDSISQSVSLDIQRMLGGRQETMEKKKDELKKAFKNQFGQTIGMSFIGS